MTQTAADIALVRAAMESRYLVSPDVCYSLAPLLDLLEKLIAERNQEENRPCQRCRYRLSMLLGEYADKVPCYRGTP